MIVSQKAAFVKDLKEFLGRKLKENGVFHKNNGRVLYKK
jgi:hypothetical protein